MGRPGDRSPYLDFDAIEGGGSSSAVIIYGEPDAIEGRLPNPCHH
jgi:hypothetical protein